MEIPPHDFKFCLIKWSTSRRRFSSQLDTLRTRVASERPDMLILVDIPRHHAKKVGQQDWTKDFFVSKESRAMTDKRGSEPGVPTLITVVFSRFPFFSEQWFPLDTAEREVAHIAEVCIPLNAWHPDRSPIGLLQEYQLSYDEVSMLTFVVAPHTEPEGLTRLNETFSPEKVSNTVIFVLPGNISSEEATTVNCGTKKLSMSVQPRLWKVVSQGVAVSLASGLGQSIANEDSEEDQ